VSFRAGSVWRGKTMMDGASPVGVGSGVYCRGMEVFRLVAEEMAEWMAANGYSSLRQIIGTAHGVWPPG